MEQEILRASDPSEVLHYTTLIMCFYNKVFLSCFEDHGPISGLKSKGTAASVFIYPKKEFGSRHLKGSIQQ